MMTMNQPWRQRVFVLMIGAAALIPGGVGRAQEPIRTYVIVHRVELAGVAREWAVYRAAGGWSVETIQVPTDVQDDRARTWIRESIRTAHSQAGAAAPDAFAVLLLGDAEGDTGLPTWYREQRDATIRSHRDPNYATDQPYQTLDDGDALPDFPLGRVPVQRAEEGLVVLEKIRQYERDQETMPAPNRLHVVAGEGRFGPLDRLLEWMFHQMVARLVPPAFDLRVAYAHPASVYCPPPEDLTPFTLCQLTGESLFFNYIGHGGPTGFDQLTWSDGETSMLAVPDLDQLPVPARQPGPALLNCCSTGWFDLGERRMSLGEAMLLHPRGPVAVIAGSRPTHPYANALQQKNFVHAMLFELSVTIGMADLHAARALAERDAMDRQIDLLAAPLARLMQWPSTLSDLRTMHTELYNLLGDPATHLPRPRGIVQSLQLENDELVIHAPGLATGQVTVIIESARDSFADPASIRPPLQRDDPAFIEKAKHNFPLAQERVLWSQEFAATSETVRVSIPHPLPIGAAIVRVLIRGENAEGEPLDAFAGIELPRSPVPADRVDRDQ